MPNRPHRGVLSGKGHNQETSQPGTAYGLLPSTGFLGEQ